MASLIDLKTRTGDPKPEPFLFSWITIPGAEFAGQVARLPLDGACLDLQHGMIGFSEAVAMIAAINAAGRAAIVRCRWNDPGLVGQALDAGAAAVIAPMIDSRAEAEALVRAAKFPPLGGRSWSGYVGPLARRTAGEYLAQTNRETLVFAMIETVAALDRVEEIAATPGLDGLFVGPSDLSIALSKGAGIDKTGPATLAAMERIAAAAGKYKLVAGAFGGDVQTATTYLRLGYLFVTVAIDVDILQAGGAALMKSLGKI